MPNGVLERCNTVEESYEFMLAYAAMAGLAETCAVAVKEEGLASAEKYQAFLVVLDRDARDSLAAIELVLAQPSISSQLVDNLNASIHLRALLTDLFLVDEILSKHDQPAGQAVSSNGE